MVLKTFFQEELDLKPKQLNETFDLPQSEPQPDVVSPPEVAEVPKPKVNETEPEVVIPPPEAEEEPLPPAPKGAYNLDFLDNLDDPNFNPFETKTKVENKFETKSDPPPKIEKVEKPVVEASANQKPENDSDQLNLDFEPPKRAPPKLGQNRPKKAIKGGQKPAPKPKVVKPESKPADVEPDLPAEEPDMPLPAKGAYNFDFDKFDDPNFNPFETKTKVVNKFEEKDPIETPKPEVEPEVKPKPEVVDEKPPTKPSEMMDVGNDDLSELNTAMEPPKRAPPKLGQRRPPAKKKTAPTKKAPPQKPATPPPADAEDEEPLPPAPKGAYNLDFLDNLDDPNFNPFETKTKVENKFDEKIETKQQPDVPKEQPEVSTEKPKAPKEQPEVPSEKPDVASEHLDELNVDFEPPKRAPPKLGQRRPPVKKKVKKVVKPEVTKEPEADDAPLPAKGAYAIDFDKFDDPNYNPFETKSKVSNQESANQEPDLPKPKAGGYNLDFLDNLDDPNFNPFETKSKVENKPISANETTITKPEESSPVKLEPEIKSTEPPTQQKSKFLDNEIFKQKNF